MIFVKFVFIYLLSFGALMFLNGVFMNGAFNGLMFVLAAVVAVVITRALRDPNAFRPDFDGDDDDDRKER